MDFSSQLLSFPSYLLLLLLPSPLRSLSTTPLAPTHPIFWNGFLTSLSKNYASSSPSLFFPFSFVPFLLFSSFLPLSSFSSPFPSSLSYFLLFLSLPSFNVAPDVLRPFPSMLPIFTLRTRPRVGAWEFVIRKQQMTKINKEPMTDFHMMTANIPLTLAVKKSINSLRFSLQLGFLQSALLMNYNCSRSAALLLSNYRLPYRSMWTMAT